MFNKLKHGFELSVQLAISSFKIKNEGTYLGIFWYLLSPLLLFLLLWLIFFDRIGQAIPKYPLYLMAGIIMFNFFQQATNEATQIIRESRNLIKSINFPRESLIMAGTLKFFFSHIFEVVLFAAIILIFGGSLTGLIFYPLILLLLFIFIFGFSLILASLSAHFVDMANIWNFISRLIWLGTPIFYEIGGQSKLFVVNLFNPMYYYITLVREVVVYSRLPEPWVVLGAIGYSVIFLIAGLILFKKLKPKFSELI